MIRIIVEGDKSRYQFLRSLLQQAGPGPVDISTENLAVQTIRLRRPENAVAEGFAGQIFQWGHSADGATENVDQTGKLREAVDGVTEKPVNREVRLLKSKMEKIFYSRRLPLNTELIFPAEFSPDDSGVEAVDGENTAGKRKPWDRILFFDEFPYRTQLETMQQSKKSMQHDPSRCEIILVKNGRKALQSDISTEESALEQAREEYLAEGYSVSVFQREKPPEFLLSPHMPGIQKNSQYRRELAAVRTRIERELGIEYDLACLGLDGGESIEQIISNYTLLASFTQYNPGMNGKNVLVFYYEKARSFFWDAKAYIFWNVTAGIYKNYMSELCLWNMERDLDSLKIKVQKHFRDYVMGKNVLVFRGGEENYREFINRHPEEMEFKRRIQSFFKEELRNLIREQMMERIRKMEELIDEKVC